MSTLQRLLEAVRSARWLAHTDPANRTRHFARARFWLRWARDEKDRDHARAA